MCILIGKRPMIAIIALDQFAKYKFFLQSKSCETYTLCISFALKRFGEIRDFLQSTHK